MIPKMHLFELDFQVGKRSLEKMVENIERFETVQDGGKQTKKTSKDLRFLPDE